MRYDKTFTLELSNAPHAQVEANRVMVEHHLYRMIEHCKDPSWLDKWETIPGKNGDMPSFRYVATDGTVVVISCLEKNDEYSQYLLECDKGIDYSVSCYEHSCIPVENSVETLYEQVAVHKCTEKDALCNTGYSD